MLFLSSPSFLCAQSYLSVNLPVCVWVKGYLLFRSLYVYAHFCVTVIVCMFLCFSNRGDSMAIQLLKTDRSNRSPVTVFSETWGKCVYLSVSSSGCGHIMWPQLLHVNYTEGYALPLCSQKYQKLKSNMIRSGDATTSADIWPQQQLFSYRCKGWESWLLGLVTRLSYTDISPKE